MQKNRLSPTKAKGHVVWFFDKKGLPECKPEWNREAITVFSRLPSLMAADKPCPQLQPSLIFDIYGKNHHFNKKNDE